MVFLQLKIIGLIMRCRICKNEIDNKIYIVREMMLGTREEFKYFECSNCGCLQIFEIPENIEKFYPSQYYSYKIEISTNHFKKILKRCRNNYSFYQKGSLGRILNTIAPNKTLNLIGQIKLSIESQILDVGCGAGQILLELKELGFNNLLGIDPFIESDINYSNGLEILKKSIFEINGVYDLIMFHHSFEHIAEQLETLQKARALLKDEGTILIRIPTVSSYAWERYRENWVQLDAPRHFYLHSICSMKLLANNAGLRIEKVIYDATEFQFIGSEQYKKDIPLKSENSYYVNMKKSIFSKQEIADFKRKTQELNAKNLGDSCAFFLRKLIRDEC